MYQLHCFPLILLLFLPLSLSLFFSLSLSPLPSPPFTSCLSFYLSTCVSVIDLLLSPSSTTWTHSLHNSSLDNAHTDDRLLSTTIKIFYQFPSKRSFSSSKSKSSSSSSSFSTSSSCFPLSSLSFPPFLSFSFSFWLCLPCLLI